MGTTMNTADLTAAIATLQDKHAALTKRAAAVNDEIQLEVQHTRELGEQHSALIAEQSAITQAIEWAQVGLYVIGLIGESKNSDRKANIRQIK